MKAGTMTTVAAKHAQKIRFGAVGVASTALDFGLLFILTHLGMNPIAANYVSTGTALIFSFAVNRKYTFRAHGGTLRRQLVLFFVVTLIGLWVLQPLLLIAADAALAHSGLGAGLTLFIGKLLASVVTLVWNYVFYSRLVFKGDVKPSPEPVL